MENAIAASEAVTSSGVFSGTSCSDVHTVAPDAVRENVWALQQSLQGPHTSQEAFGASADHHFRPLSLLIRSGSRVAPLSAERAKAAYAFSAWLT